MTTNYKHTLYASYIGYITQAIINNLAPLLFLTFQKEFEISLEQIALLVSVNFLVQLFVDLLAIKFVDKIGYRISIIIAHILAGLGLICLAILPGVFANPYVGLLGAICIYAVGGGLIEVLVSPIVESCPTDEKASSMSLLHSFYCWGHVGVVVLSTIFFVVVGTKEWRMLAFLWAIIPMVNAVYFSRVPMRNLNEEHEAFTVKKLFTMKLFWMFLLFMICAGAAEQSMSQWASAFAESGLKVSKTVGDLAGPCMFAICMGIARIFYSKFSTKIDLKKFLLYSCILCACSYLLAAFSPDPIVGLLGCALCGLSVGMLWPGTFSLATQSCPTGGTAMFALLALAGDLGCSSGPALVGVVSEYFNNNLKLGLLSAIIFPIILIAGVIYLRKLRVQVSS